MKQTLRIVFAMVVLVLIGCEKPNYGTPDPTVASLGTPEDNEIWYTTIDENQLSSLDQTAFDATIEGIYNSEFGISVIRFDKAVTTIGDNAFDGCFNIFNLSLPNSIVEIGKRAFYDCKNMECLTLGGGLRHCGSEAFDFCVNLHSLHIPSIYNWCKIEFDNKKANPLSQSYQFFIGGEKVESLIIPSSVTEIHDYAFCNNTAIKRVSVASTVREIGKEAFYGCDNISKVEIDSIPAWCSIDFEGELANPLSIAFALYMGGKKVSDITLNSVEEISSYAFINCTTIKTVTTDNTLTDIGTDAFRNCSALATVTLGERVQEIGEHAFWNCKALSKLICNAPQPPILDGDNILGTYEGNLVVDIPTIEVPSAYLNTYKSDAMWSKYSDYITVIE